MTLQKLNRPKLISAKPLDPQSPTLQSMSPEELKIALRSQGCVGCELGCQKNFIAPVVYRGNPKSKIMLIGEAPGMYEDREGIPFTGPAGRVLDEMFESVGWNTNERFYITNTVKCRPVAPKGSGKQNIPPSEAHRAACRPFLEQEVARLQPHTVGLLGGVAAKSVLGLPEKTRMSDVVGKIYLNEKYPFVQFYVFYHPAYILRVRNDPAKKEKVWPTIEKHIAEFVKIVQDMEMEVRIND